MNGEAVEGVLDKGAFRSASHADLVRQLGGLLSQSPTGGTLLITTPVSLNENDEIVLKTDASKARKAGIL
jgi:hypothetical protein